MELSHQCSDHMCFSIIKLENKSKNINQIWLYTDNSLLIVLVNLEARVGELLPVLQLMQAVGS